MITQLIISDLICFMNVIDTSLLLFLIVNGKSVIKMYIMIASCYTLYNYNINQHFCSGQLDFLLTSLNRSGRNSIASRCCTNIRLCFRSGRKNEIR